MWDPATDPEQAVGPVQLIQALLGFCLGSPAQQHGRDCRRSRSSPLGLGSPLAPQQQSVRRERVSSKRAWHRRVVMPSSIRSGGGLGAVAVSVGCRWARRGPECDGSGPTLGNRRLGAAAAVGNGAGCRPGRLAEVQVGRRHAAGGWTIREPCSFAEGRGSSANWRRCAVNTGLAGGAAVCC